MKSKLLLTLYCILASVSAFAQYQFPTCKTPWVAGTYNQGNEVSYNNANYKAKYYTTAVPGSNGDWELTGRCGDGGLGPNYTGPQRIIGYLPTWVSSFNAATFDASTVTHINISFLMFQRNTSNYADANFASIAFDNVRKREVDSMLVDLNILNKAHQKGTTVSAALGGATDYAFLWLMEKYYNDDAKMDQIATLIANYVNTSGLDGVDLDLECWWKDASIANTKEIDGRVRGDKWGGVDQGPHPAGIGMTKLAQKLRQKMPTKLISCAVFGGPNYGNNYDDAMAQYMDWVGLMTYDFTGSWDASPIGPHSALYKVPLNTYPGQSDNAPIYAAQDALEYWMGTAAPAWNHDGGFNVPKAKLVIGVPFYGYDLSTKKPSGNGYIAPVYKDIVAQYPNAATSYDPLDPRQQIGFIGTNGKKIYYDTPKMASEKINYTKNYGHQGVIIWELTGDVPYSSSSSLLKALNEAAGGNPAPTVSITAPKNDSIFASVPATITISATAADANGTVSKVEFYSGTTLLNTDTSAPYSFTWTNVSAGAYQLTAKAYDNQNASSTSSIINVTVGNAVPAVSITAPANNATFIAPAIITIAATASDADGTVSKVEFYNGSTLLGTDTSSPYSYTWNNVGVGTYQLTAKAYDNQNVSKTSSAVNVSVTTTNVAPMVTLATPTVSGTAPATVTLSATASDSDGSVAKVEFFNGSTLLNTDSVAPYGYTWNNVAAGTYSITAKATDNLGLSTTTSVQSVTVENGTGGIDCSAIPTYQTYPTVYNQGNRVKYNNVVYECQTNGLYNVTPGTAEHWWKTIGPCGGSTNPSPTVTFATPTVSGTAPATVTLSATATDDGSISKVEFYNGTTLLNTDTTSPYSYSWTSVAAGTYSVSAKAYDNLNATATASTSVTVNSANNLTVTLTTPVVSGNAPATVNLSATASASPGTITKVEFFNGSNLLFSDTSSPYSYSWTGVAAGTYSITAKATDNAGASVTSASASVVVSSGGTDCGSIPAWSASTQYATPGIQVSYNGKIYQNKWWTQNERPDLNNGTGKAWEYLSDCAAGAQAMSAQTTPIIANVYPNPFSGATVTADVNVTLGESIEVVLLNAQSMAVYSTQTLSASSTGVQSVSVNASSAPAGTLIVKVTTSRGSENRTIIKQ